MKLMEGRLYLYVSPRPDGWTRVTITRDTPIAARGAAVIRSRGTIEGEKVELDIPPASAGPAGQDATPAQVAAQVSTYLTAHPPAAGRGPTSAEVAAAVTAYFAGKAVPERVEFAVTLADTYVLGILAGADQKRIPCAGIRTTDSLSIQPTGAVPAGYGGFSVWCTENGFVRVGFSRPTIIASSSIPFKITAFR